MIVIPAGGPVGRFYESVTNKPVGSRGQVLRKCYECYESVTNVTNFKVGLLPA